MNNRGFKELREEAKTEINPKKETYKLFLLIGIAFGVVLTIVNCLR